MSARRAAASIGRGDVRRAVYTRDGHRCLLAVPGSGQPGVPRCIGPLTPHHLRKSAQGGPYSEANLVTLCAGHNDWLETATGAGYGQAVGLVIRRGSDTDWAWTTMRAAGLVRYWWDGTS
jgi:hypothetical protein